MSIDDLTLTDLTIVNDTDVLVKIYCDWAYVGVCGQICIWFMNRVLRIA
jgi:hypothetical protein